MLLTRDRAYAAVVILLSVFLYRHIAQFPLEARLFPEMVLWLLMLLGGLLLIRRQGRQAEEPFLPSYRNFFLTLLFFFFFVFAVDKMGYFVASTLFMTAFPVLLGYRNWKALALNAALYLAAVYLIFVLAFSRVLP